MTGRTKKAKPLTERIVKLAVNRNVKDPYKVYYNLRIELEGKLEAIERELLKRPCVSDARIEQLRRLQMGLTGDVNLLLGLNKKSEVK